MVEIEVEQKKNNFFFIFLKIFLIPAHQNDMKTYKIKFILNKKNSKFLETRFTPR